MQFADDALFFGEWSWLNVSNLIHILKCFKLSSGLKVNLDKSRLFGVDVPTSDVEVVASSLGCVSDQLPFIYLGLPLGKKMRNRDGWSIIIDRFRERLSSWKTRNLSIGGRLTLVKSVLGSIPVYYLSLFKAHISIIKTLESIRCRFFWDFKDNSGRISWVKWRSILLDFKSGGIRLGCLLSKNLGFLGKWKWRFLTEKQALWRSVIKCFYGEDDGFNSSRNSVGTSGTWVDILKAIKSIEAIDPSFKRSFVRKVASGNDTSFWHDPWCGNGLPLNELFPRATPRGRASGDLNSLIFHMGNISLSPFDIDKWVWMGDPSGLFKVSSLSKSLQNLSLNGFGLGVRHVWNSWIPRKVNVCVWRAALNRLATRDNLIRRGIVIASERCPLCGVVDEDVHHILISCSRVLPVWRKV
ncbi:RNA-directed DNA polymerase, eukaryota, reverse transcriptase zinc-binding domain protein [Tanacetum coccineum]